MRAACGFAVVLALLATAGRGRTGPATTPAPAEGPRYGVPADLKSYPQGSAKETLASVLKAVDAGRYDYLVAQLADPAWVDDRVGRLYGGRFADQVQDTRARLDPPTVRLLRRFLAEGEWMADRDQESARLKDQSDRGLFFCKKADRWYLEHRSKPGS
jgi:hypothetical protein